MTKPAIKNIKAHLAARAGNIPARFVEIALRICIYLAPSSALLALVHEGARRAVKRVRAAAVRLDALVAREKSTLAMYGKAGRAILNANPLIATHSDPTDVVAHDVTCVARALDDAMGDALETYERENAVWSALIEFDMRIRTRVQNSSWPARIHIVTEDLSHALDELHHDLWRVRALVDNCNSVIGVGDKRRSEIHPSQPQSRE